MHTAESTAWGSRRSVGSQGTMGSRRVSVAAILSGVPQSGNGSKRSVVPESDNASVGSAAAASQRGRRRSSYVMLGDSAHMDMSSLHTLGDMSRRRLPKASFSALLSDVASRRINFVEGMLTTDDKERSRVLNTVAGVIDEEGEDDVGSDPDLRPDMAHLSCGQVASRHCKRASSRSYKRWSACCAVRNVPSNSIRRRKWS